MAVLGSSVQRSAAQKHSSRTGTALRRRIAVCTMVLLALVLVTISFRESESGGLHSAQDAGATVLHPFQVGIERVVRPFRDLAGYVDGLIAAKAENARLRRDLAVAQQEAIQNRTAFEQNRALRAITKYHAPPSYPNDYAPVPAAISAYSAAQFEQQVVVAAGKNAGVRRDDPVLDQSGYLVGRITRVSSRSARVALLTDESSAVSAQALRRDARGLVRPGRAGTGALLLDYVRKSSELRTGDRIVTAGSQRGQLPSDYPRGIPIGRVTDVSQSDTDLYKTVQVEPFADVDSLESVIVLVTRRGKR